MTEKEESEEIALLFGEDDDDDDSNSEKSSPSTDNNSNNSSSCNSSEISAEYSYNQFSDDDDHIIIEEREEVIDHGYACSDEEDGDFIVFQKPTKKPKQTKPPDQPVITAILQPPSKTVQKKGKKRKSQWKNLSADTTTHSKDLTILPRFIPDPVALKCNPLSSKNEVDLIRLDKDPYPVGSVGFSGGLKQVLDARKRRLGTLSAKEKIKLILDRRLTAKQVRFLHMDATLDSNFDDTNLVRRSSRMQRAQDFYTKPTTLCCHWCTEPCISVPLPIAHRQETRYSKDRTNYHWYKVSGVYCSPGCVIASAQKKNCVPATQSMLRQVYGITTRNRRTKKLQFITPSPSPLTLKKFGGPYDVESFRALSILGIDTSEVNLPLAPLHDPRELPFIPIASGIEEVERIEYTYRDVISDRAIEYAIKNNGRMPDIEPKPLVPIDYRSNIHSKDRIMKTRTMSPKKNKRARKRKTGNNKNSVISADMGHKGGNYLSLEEQLEQSANRLRLQRDELRSEYKSRRKQTKNLMDFMLLEKGKKK